MATFRDRFFTPKVAHAVTAPSSILVLGAGAALGILATVGSAGVLAPLVGALVGGAVGYGGKVALAIPRRERGSAIDEFAVDEPWRHAVKDAQQARNRYRDAVATFRKGPMRSSLEEISERLDDAVEECWQIAQQGQLVSDARKRINDREVNWELQRTETLIKMEGGGTPSAVQQQTIASLRSQLASAARMEALIASTRDQLALINARMDESVTQAIELSVSNRTDDLDPLNDSVDDIVEDLESLRLAMGDLDALPAAATGAQPPPLPTAAADPGSLPAPPDPPSRPADQVPPPLPDQRPGPGQTSPPS